MPDPAPTPEPRGFLDVGSGPSMMSLVLLGLGAAAGGLLLVGGLSAYTASRSSKPEGQPERVKS